jgi:hypothetical protein
MFKKIKYFASAVFSTDSNAKFPPPPHPPPPKKNVFTKQQEMKASRRLAENDIITSGVNVKIQQVAVRRNYENPSNDAKGEVE